MPAGPAVDGEELHGRRRLEELELVLDVAPRKRDLLERLLVHEDDLVAGVVEVLDVLRLRADARHLLAGAERLVDDGARADALQLRAHERAALARLHVLELDDAPDLPVELDVHAVLELVGGDRLGHGGSSSRRSAPVLAQRERDPW